ncbi:MAG: recombination protein RecR [Planctomycetes bacterium]|nr:recombination protein RecR [Planctomycetota bacterium]
MSAYPDALARLIEELGRLPGVGEKTAERMAIHLLRAPQAEALALADAIRAVKESIRVCALCATLTDRERCGVCEDPARDRDLLCVVEQPNDMWALEKVGAFRGLYHVLGGRIAPLDGVGPEQLTLGRLVERVRGGAVREVILATNPTLEGDATALYVQRALAPFGSKLTRIARGIPAGSTLEYASRMILTDALEGRRAL